ncbi:DHH family phosphoesterase [Streptococcus himalayensis]|uniref:DHH family phosphoesterase n=1 Tax=Streptococcus himalayensis TaxID=1888195 RepID=A0A917EHU1_9STRE|nr:bifunctional oligoribonuclease/PAP phosphatase NrnA [Streptococcus himalayensis]GGE37705.1 DHH family phosphoesterase [Streptococcus himalayensis]
MDLQLQILHKIKEYDTIIIHRHMRPDPDALGSQMGLKHLLQRHFPQKTILAPGYDEPSLTWLAHMDTVEDSNYEGALVIVCDTANTARIDDKRYEKGDFLIKIDHHPNDDAYGDLLWVDTNASSTSEMIAHFAFTHDLDLDDYTAKLLYAGIIGDTGRFLYPATTAKTLEIASKLRNYPFDFAGLARKMDSFSFPIAKLQGYVYDHLEMDENGVARVILTQELLKENGLTDADTAAIVSAPGKIDQVELWGIFVEQESAHYRVRLRSKFVPINEVAKKHDGGGHPLASGANAYSKEEVDQIYQELQYLVKNKEN